MKNTVIYNGNKYTESTNGYFVATRLKNGRRPHDLHRQVYEDKHGVIPPGYQVHHIDHNKSNNDITNLVAMSASAHRKHHSKHNSFVEGACIHCGGEFKTQRAYRRKYCGTLCQSDYRRKQRTDNIDKKCPVCGNAFNSNKYKHQVCCSISCANKKRGT